MKNALLIIAALASGIVSGLISEETHSVWGSDGWFSHISPGILFGIATAWFVVIEVNKKIVRGLSWIAISAAAFYIAVFCMMFGGFAGGTILALTFPLIFEVKNKLSWQHILSQIGMIAVLGIIGYLAIDSSYLFPVWQSVAAVCIISRILLDKKIAARAIRTS